jgi:hypothetical protein
MRRVALAILLVSIGLSSAAPVGARTTWLAKTVTGRVTALSPTVITVRESTGATLACSIQSPHQMVFARLSVGQNAMVICHSEDRGATWVLERVYAGEGNRISLRGVVVVLSGSGVTLELSDQTSFTCKRSRGAVAGAAALKLGAQVVLTCVVVDHDFTVSSVKGVANAKPVLLQFTGRVQETWDDQVWIATADNTNAYRVTIPATLLETVRSLSASNALVAVVAKPSGNRWLLVSVTPV